MRLHRRWQRRLLGDWNDLARGPQHALRLGGRVRCILRGLHRHLQKKTNSCVRRGRIEKIGRRFSICLMLNQTVCMFYPSSGHHAFVTHAPALFRGWLNQIPGTFRELFPMCSLRDLCLSAFTCGHGGCFRSSRVVQLLASCETM